jgi:hypothetical protein
LCLLKRGNPCAGIDPGWSSVLRSAALAVILLRAGLGLDPAALRQLSALVLRWITVPTIPYRTGTVPAAVSYLDVPVFLISGIRIIFREPVAIHT